MLMNQRLLHYLVIQCLTIAIIFDLIYLQRAMSRAWLTSINIDPKCNSYLVYYQYIIPIFLG